VWLAKKSLRGEDRSANRHLQGGLSVSTEGQRRAVAVKRVVGGEQRVAIGIDAVLLVRRRTHGARHLHDTGDSHAKLDLDRGDVQRVAHARLQLTGAVGLAIVVPRRVRLGRSWLTSRCARSCSLGLSVVTTRIPPLYVASAPNWLIRMLVT